MQGKGKVKTAESMAELTTVGKEHQHRKLNATRAVCAYPGLKSGVLYFEAVSQLNPEPGTLSSPLYDSHSLPSHRDHNTNSTKPTWPPGPLGDWVGSINPNSSLHTWIVSTLNT